MLFCYLSLESERHRDHLADKEHECKEEEIVVNSPENCVALKRNMRSQRSSLFLFIQIDEFFNLYV